ncbi:hypothetical protein GPECTOR_28g842 [Gonium pectorale]|uniref:Malonyl-CoA:ACP transacylase (MAT) domain-containing protein n=1 Tax=Gonium pectorale TaxID=33097 RepID=A0A150GF13_GONPE|nr:hypothetical protein GPECTOR_28g842 [Gonium pectorale]|eukprot:KXZ48432.1 hypothetical protein GPECTOR_28g842 [Gonium pectorale]
MALLSSAQRCALKGRAAAFQPCAPALAGRGRRALAVRAAADDAFASYKPTVAALFPGQGAQSVGMAKDLVSVPAAKELFDKAADILGYDLYKLCVEGPKDKLDSTAISQPAIYVASLAAVEKLRATEGQAAIDSIDVAAGLSLGEYTALAFAGAMSFEDGLRLVALRGASMQAAADAQPSSMVSVIGLDSAKVAELCKAATAEAGEDKPVKIANFLCPGNYAVSGSKEGCDAVEKLGKSFGARMTVRLAVAGAFHTEYMSPAVGKLREALAATTISTPRIPVVSNVDAAPHSDPEVIKDILSRQVTSPVLWENTVKILMEKGMTKSYEIGPGKVIAGIVKRIDKAHNIINITA